MQKIAGLAKGRESASMDEITEIISTDSGVTQRLMSMAYPKTAARLGATVQMATSRLGVNRVIVVMVGDLLTKADDTRHLKRWSGWRLERPIPYDRRPAGTRIPHRYGEI